MSDSLKTTLLIERNIADSVSGTITWEYNLIPRKQGSYIIGAISIPYFDTIKESWDFAKSDPIKLNILFNLTFYEFIIFSCI